MAEALIEHMTGGRISARSAGSHPKTQHPNAVRAMGERGIDITDRSTKHLRRFMRMRFDAVVTLCDRVREVCPEFPHHPRAIHWSVPDPAATGVGGDADPFHVFQRTAAELETRVGYLIALLDSIPAREETQT